MTINKSCAQYCIDLIRCLLQEKEIPQIPKDVALQELFEFSRHHNVEAMVFHGLEQLNLDHADPVWKNWSNRANLILTQSIVQLSDRDMLFSTLTEAGINILPVKGCWMKELYPEIDYRQMSDLDILIPTEKVQGAKRVMLSLGFRTDSFENQPNHAGYLKPPYTEVELHTALLLEDDGYYDDVWVRALPEPSCKGLYRLSAEDEYIFYLLHLNKHLENSGTGIRSILDSVIYRRAYPNMDKNYLHRELEKLGLWERTKQIELLSDCWFTTGQSVCDNLNPMADYILSAGSYGTLENYSAQQMKKLDEAYKNPIVRFFAYWMIRICRPRKEMEYAYPILKKIPILLPAFWIHRAIMKFFSRPKDIWNHVMAVFTKVK